MIVILGALFIVLALGIITMIYSKGEKDKTTEADKKNIIYIDKYRRRK